MGNIRLSYSDLDKSGDIDKETEIIEENNYYPFGLKHRGYNEIVNAETEHKFRFNDTEFDDDFDLNWYNMPLRHQDPTTGRWNGIDPVTHFSSSTYAGYNNNPVFWADPSGADGVIYLVLSGGFDRATAESIADHTMAIFQHFELDIKVTVLNSASELPQLDATDNWAVIGGSDRNAIVDEAEKIGPAWVNETVRKDSWGKGWENHTDTSGESELANDAGMGIVISHTDNLRDTRYVNLTNPFIGIDGRNITFIEGSALTLAHAAGHDTRRKVKVNANYTAYDKMSHLSSGIMADGNGVYQDIHIRGVEGLLDFSKNNYTYQVGMHRRYTPSKAQFGRRVAKGLLVALSSFFKGAPSPVSIGPYTRMYSSWW